jgi:hypothetical protein
MVTRLGKFSPFGRLFILSSFFKTYRCRTVFLLLFFHGIINVLILTKKSVGKHFGRFFFTISSGHPALIPRVHVDGLLKAQNGSETMEQPLYSEKRQTIVFETQRNFF